jgi:hypothetical protein
MREDRGLSNAQIARRLSISEGAVNWHLLKLGIERNGRPPKNFRPPAPVVHMRNGKPVRGFTPMEDAKLLKLALQGLTHTQIGKKMGRRPNSICGRLFTLARHEERAEANQHSPATITKAR